MTSDFDHEREWLDTTETATYLRIPLGTLYRLINERRLATGGDPLRVRRSDLAACIEQCRIRPGQLAHLDPNAKVRPRPDAPVPLRATGEPDRRYRRRRPA